MHVNRMGTCWNCKGSLSDDNFGRQDECPGCHRETRVCRNCFFYDALCYNACREVQAERVVDKEKSNFCDFFRSAARSAQSRIPKNAPKNAKTPRQEAEALFKQK